MQFPDSPYDRLRGVAVTRVEQLAVEVPTAVRRLGRLFLVLSLSVPAFLGGCLALLAWRLLG